MQELQIDFKDPDRKADALKMFQSVQDASTYPSPVQPEPERSKSSSANRKLEEDIALTSSLVCQHIDHAMIKSYSSSQPQTFEL